MKKNRLLLIGAILFGIAACSTSSQVETSDAAKGRSLSADAPNIILIVNDDMAPEEWAYLPKVTAFLAERGSWAPNFVIPNALCCPSRAAFLTGQYNHNNGVLTNSPPNGGHQAFNDSTTMATVIRGAGYKTGFFGKYLNGYEEAGTYVPPGWNRWVAVGRASFYDFDINVAGQMRHYSDYHFDRLAFDLGEKWSTKQIEKGLPFLAVFMPSAPHGPSEYEPQFAELYPEIEDTELRDRARSLATQDDVIMDLFAGLEAAGELANTYVIFTTDNGYNLEDGSKKSPLEGVSVPGAYIMGPGVVAGSIMSGLIANIDMLPTFLEITGSAPLASVDGRSIFGPGRQVVLLEGWKRRGLNYRGYRATTEKYVEWEDGTRELFDLLADPGETTNLAGSTDLSSRSAFLNALAGCVGDECRALEDSGP